MKHTYIIAEAGVNHNGDIVLAKRLVDVAVKAGADAVKFQTFKAEEIVSKTAQKANYQKRNAPDGLSQQAMLKALELSEAEYKELKNYCGKLKIDFLSTPFDLLSIDFLLSLGLETFKIASGEITNLPYLEKLGKLNRKIILSTGMSSLDEVQQAIDVLIRCGTSKVNITLLHANTQYPTPMNDVNLFAMQTLQREFDVNVGYSDHTLGIEVPIAATALGAVVIEKHITLDRGMSGPDHIASIEPDELQAMVCAIRNIDMALGDGVKKASVSEIENMSVARKSIVARRTILKGEVFSQDNLTVKRPGNGISPMHWYDIIGTKAKKNYQEDDLI